MCGIAGIVYNTSGHYSTIKRHLEVMNKLQAHRGPDGEGVWVHKKAKVGFGHRRLSIIDLTLEASQPMCLESGLVITYNGEIYNYIELREELGKSNFKTTSDTEVILRTYEKWGEQCVDHLRGMFAFAIWDERKQKLFCARDRFGIKPFYYTNVNNIFYFGSEVKTLMPFLKNIETDLEGFKDYLTFQFCLGKKTLFKGVNELLPAHTLTIVNNKLKVNQYWEVYYSRDFNHTSKYFEEKIFELMNNSVEIHSRSDVPIGAYVSGGVDSSAVAALVDQKCIKDLLFFTGKFSEYTNCDESQYACLLAEHCKIKIHEIDIVMDDFINNIRDIIYHLDYPVAGPGSFPQYMVSRFASKFRKVVLGGQGGDEIFGGYARYLIAYFEQCIKGAIDGTLYDGNFVVTYESIIPNLITLKNYKPLLKDFWQKGLFEKMDKRYFQLINRSHILKDEINWELLGDYSPFETFNKIFNGKNVDKGSYFDNMTNFDFKTLLPALLHVEDRVSMAHGLESRVPIVDHTIAEFAATIPSDIKFEGGALKKLFKDAMTSILPKAVTNRKDKMGFPVPLTEWFNGPAHDFIFEVFMSHKALQRDLINNKLVLNQLSNESKFGRTIWGLFCLEIWQQEFHDKEYEFKKLLL